LTQGDRGEYFFLIWTFCFYCVSIYNIFINRKSGELAPPSDGRYQKFLKIKVIDYMKISLFNVEKNGTNPPTTQTLKTRDIHRAPY